MFGEIIVEVFNKGGGDGVVGVYKGKIFAGGKLKATIAGGGNPSVGLAKIYAARIFLGVIFGYFGGSVDGSVVYENDFEVFVGLGEYAIETCREIRCDIEYGDDDGYFGGLTFMHKCDRMALFP